MTHPNKLLVILTLCFFSMSLTIGCGGGDEPTPSASDTSSTDAPSADDDSSEESEDEASTKNDNEDTDSPKQEDKPKATSSNGAGGTGSVTGVIKLTGEIPTLPVLIEKGDKTAKDAEVCAAEAVPNQSLVVNADNKGIANVFVYMRKAPEGAPEFTPPSDPIVFDQKGCEFIPHALFVPPGQIVKAINSDGVAHNLHTYPLKNPSLNQIIQPNDQEGLALDYNESEILPFKVGCDIHPWMVAWHFPLDHPYAAVTDENGSFTIENLPPGEHDFRIWQEKSGYLEKKLTVTVEAGKPAEVTLEYSADKFAEE